MKANKASNKSIFESNNFRVSSSPANATKYDIYLFGPIEDVEQFIDAIEAMNNAGENDLVIIHLSTPGGSIDATDTFLQAMNECPAKIIVRASGGVHSAGTMILLAADELTLSPNCNLLFHNGSFGSAGKTSDVISQLSFDSKFMQNLMWSTYEGFLTDNEIEELLRGRDFWMDAPEFMARWRKREELRNKQDEENDTRDCPIDEEDSDE